MGVIDKSLDFETGLLGSLLIEPEILGEMMLEVRPEDFSFTAYRHIFTAARELWQEGKPVDAITVAAAAGADYKDAILDCMTLTPTAANWRAYARGARSETIGHQLDDLAKQMIEAPTTEEKQQIAEQMQDLRNRQIAAKEVTWLDGLRAGFERQGEQKRPNYLYFGIPQLDQELYIRPGSFVILGGYASTGKTALATQFAIHFARCGRRVGIYSYETDDETLFDRMMAQSSGVNFSRIKNYRATQEDFDALVNTVAATKHICLTYVGAAGWDVAKIRAHAVTRRFDVVLIDYVQLIRGRGDNRAEEVARVSMELHTFAQQTGTTVIGLSQLTPTGQATPGMNDLRESRQLTQDADVILMIYRPTENDAGPNDRVLHVQKNKEGRVFRMRLELDPATMRMEPPKIQNYDEDEDDDRRRRRHQGARSRR